jgi:integrase
MGAMLSSLETSSTLSDIAVTLGDRISGRNKGSQPRKRLRNALITAGITRRELFESSEVTLRVDFHSFRRAYATALAEVDANGLLSMRLTGHKSMATHNLYVMRSGTMRVPEAALPKVPLG